MPRATAASTRQGRRTAVARACRLAVALGVRNLDQRQSILSRPARALASCRAAMWINSRWTCSEWSASSGNRIEGCRVRGQSVKIATSAKVTKHLPSRPHARRLSGMVRTPAFAADVVFGQLSASPISFSPATQRWQSEYLMVNAGPGRPWEGWSVRWALRRHSHDVPIEAHIAGPAYPGSHAPGQQTAEWRGRRVYSRVGSRRRACTPRASGRAPAPDR